MSKNIFDDISEANIISHKRLEKAGEKSSHDSSNPEVNDDISESNSENGNQSGISLDSMTLLSQTLQAGFEKMNKSFENFGNKIVENFNEKFDLLNECLNEPQEEIEDEDTAQEEIQTETGNIFDQLADENSSSTLPGPKLNQSLAKLANKALSNKMNGDNEKAKLDKYLLPSNLDNASVPKINRPIWEVMSQNNKKADLKSQFIQKNLLRSSVPIAQVMEDLFDKKDNLEQINIDSIINKLADSLIFLGTANVELTSVRKETVKRDLPLNMKGICAFSEEYCPDFLFGNDLNTKIKEVSELNKIKKTVSNPINFRGGKGFARGRGSFRGRGLGPRFLRKGLPARPKPYEPKNGLPPKGATSNKSH